MYPIVRREKLADKIYLMDGWQQSSGARIEKIWAERTNKGIYVL